MVTAPIVLFVYNRPWHARQTVAALLRNDLAAQSDLYIYSDAAKDLTVLPLVDEVRAFIRTISGFRSVTIFEQASNFGLAKSIISGVTRVCAEHGRVIVMEDDLLTAPHFLRYMNDALNFYADIESVASIHGYWYPVARRMPETFFLRGASCWGWATWSRAWDLFESDGRKLLSQLKQQRLTGLFDLDGAMAYTKMLKHQIAGKNNSWAIRWHASTFLANRLQLSPGETLVRNIGFDASGVHCEETKVYDGEFAKERVAVDRIAVEECAEARIALIQYYLSTKRSFLRRVFDRFRRVLASAIREHSQRNKETGA